MSMCVAGSVGTGLCMHADKLEGVKCKNAPSNGLSLFEFWGDPLASLGDQQGSAFVSASQPERVRREDEEMCAALGCRSF